MTMENRIRKVLRAVESDIRYNNDANLSKKELDEICEALLEYTGSNVLDDLTGDQLKRALYCMYDMYVLGAHKQKVIRVKYY